MYIGVSACDVGGGVCEYVIYPCIYASKHFIDETIDRSLST